MSLFDRASPNDVVAPSGAVWNRVLDILEWMLRIDGGAGIMIDKDASGPTIRCTLQSSNPITATITAPLGAGRYEITLLAGVPTNVDPSGTLSLPDPGESIGTVKGILENVLESGLGSNIVGNGTFVVASPTGGTGNLSGSTVPVYRAMEWVTSVGYDNCGLSYGVVLADVDRFAFATDFFDLQIPEYDGDNNSGVTITIRPTGFGVSAVPPYGNTTYADFNSALQFTTPPETAGNFTGGYQFNSIFELDQTTAPIHGGTCGNLSFNVAVVNAVTYIAGDNEWITTNGGNGTTAGIINHIGPHAQMSDEQYVGVAGIQTSGNNTGLLQYNNFDVKFDTRGHIYEWQSGTTGNVTLYSGYTGTMTVNPTITAASAVCNGDGTITLNITLTTQTASFTNGICTGVM